MGNLPRKHTFFDVEAGPNWRPQVFGPRGSRSLLGKVHTSHQLRKRLMEGWETHHRTIIPASAEIDNTVYFTRYIMSIASMA